MIILLYILFIVLGASLASFLHCVAYREAHHIKWSKGRSQCDSCNKKLKWHNNIPVVSYVIQGGKATCCSKKLSHWHLIIELIGATLFGFVAYRYAQSFDAINLLRDIVIVTFATFTIIFDSRYGLVSIPASLLTVVLLLLIPNNLFTLETLAIGAAVGTGFFALLWLITRGKGIGVGDIWLGAVMGVALGFPNVIYALMVAYISGAIVAVYLLASKRARAKDTIPFGAFLMLGLLTVTFFF